MINGDLPKEVILVDSQDTEVGTMEVVAAHTVPGYLHRAISVFLLRPTADGGKELLVQQRSQAKFTCPRFWANTCCGNVRPGESYLDCAQRRLREELGITGVELRQIEKFEYQAACNDNFIEHEMDMIFVGEFAGDPQPNPQEVMATRWVPLTALPVELSNPELKWVPWLPIMVEKLQILDKLSD